MSKLNIKINGKLVGIEDRQLELHESKAVFENICSLLIESVHKGVLKGPDIRCYNRILNKLDLSSDLTVDLESGEIEFLKKLFSSPEVKIPPRQVKIFCSLEDLINKL